MAKVIIYYSGDHMVQGAYEVSEDTAGELLELPHWASEPVVVHKVKLGKG